MTSPSPRPPLPSPQGAAGHGDRSLGECEEVIERGLATFVEVGRALAEIRDGRLYRVTHDTFEGYCQERWKFTRVRAHQLIEAAGVLTTVNSPVPIANEAQARALSPVIRDLGPEAAAEILQEQAATGRVTASGAARRRADDVAEPTYSPPDRASPGGRAGPGTPMEGRTGSGPEARGVPGRGDPREGGADLPGGPTPGLAPERSGLPGGGSPPAAAGQTTHRRRPLPDQARTASYDLLKAAERLQRITNDDRWTRNAQQVREAISTDLRRAIEALTTALQQLEIGTTLEGTLP